MCPSFRQAGSTVKPHWRAGNSQTINNMSKQTNWPWLESNSYSLGSVRVAERLALPTSDHGVAGSNPAGGEILPKPKLRFIAQSLSYSPFHRLEMTEILLKGRETLTHPSYSLDSGLQLVVLADALTIWASQAASLTTVHGVSVSSFNYTFM